MKMEVCFGKRTTNNMCHLKWYSWKQWRWN